MLSLGVDGIVIEMKESARCQQARHGGSVVNTWAWPPMFQV
jgi:hypothetical protein